MRRRIVETPVGTLRGRDCVFLDSATFAETNTLVLRGTLNGDLCGQPSPGSDLPFVITFTGVLAVRMLELDCWGGSCSSSFDEVLESRWIAELGGKVTGRCRHFVLQTYDDVFDVVCDDVSVVVKHPNRHATPSGLTLAASANVLVPAILLLEAEGWRLEHDPDATTSWRGRRNDVELLGDDPLQLLSLAAIADSRGANWRASDSEIADVVRRFGLDRSE